MGKFYRLAILFALLLIPFSFAANIATCADDPAAPGIYTLTANLSISGTCLVVSADNVTIDCAGYSITGGNTTSFGIQTTKLNTTIDNCTISNFKHAIYFQGAKNGTIKNTSASTSRFSGYGIYLWSSDKYLPPEGGSFTT